MKQYPWRVGLLTGLLLLALLSGCGKQPAQPDTQDDTTASAELVNPELSTDNDTFQLLMLDRLIQTPDTGVTELLGDGDDQTYDAQGELATRVYHGTLFGQEVSYTVSFSLNDVTSAVVTFPCRLHSDDLIPLISEQLALEPKDDGAWHTETALVILEDTDETTQIVFQSYSLAQ